MSAAQTVAASFDAAEGMKIGGSDTVEVNFEVSRAVDSSMK